MTTARIVYRWANRMGGVALCATSLGAAMFAQSATGVDAAFETFWNAADSRQAGAAAKAIVALGVSFDDAMARLRNGRDYRGDVPTGVVTATRTAGGHEFVFTVQVPPTYHPERRYQARVQLHGGVMRFEELPRNDGSVGTLAGADQIYVMPNAWRDAPWWSDAQVENVSAILDWVKRRYNVDENRVVLSGVSDGATAAYYMAMRQTTPFASFLPLNGFIRVLGSPAIDLGGGLFPQNLRNKPLFIVNGGRDRLYPIRNTKPYTKHLQQGGVEIAYLPQPEGEHNTRWWPEVKEPFESFVRDHPRNPFPAKITWEADETAVANRAHWLVIDRIVPDAPGSFASGDVHWQDLNEIQVGTGPNIGLRALGSTIEAVVPGSPAAAMGLRPGDIVVAINGRSMPLRTNVLEVLRLFHAGDTLTLSVSRTGTRVDLSGSYDPTDEPDIRHLFDRLRPAGRVDLERQGNLVTATTRGVGAFTLLLSPDAFDFTQAVTVTVNGRRAFEGRVTKSLETLMKWAGSDNDRTMLFGAEVHVNVTP